MNVTVGGEPVEVGQSEVSIEVVEPGVWSVLVDSRSFEVCVGGGNAWIGSQSFEIQVHDPRELSGQAESSGPSGRFEMRAPMPGKVIRVLVTEGDEVTAGQGIVVVEAMKMQNEMPSPKSGRVGAVSVKPGDAVATGQVLAAIE